MLPLFWEGSLEEPWGLLTLGLAACLFAWWAVPPARETALLAWDQALVPWESALTRWGLKVPVTCLPAWEVLLTAYLEIINWLGGHADRLGRSAECLGISPVCLGASCLGGTVLSHWELALTTWKLLTAWEVWEALIAWEPTLSACELPAWGKQCHLPRS